MNKNIMSSEEIIRARAKNKKILEIQMIQIMYHLNENKNLKVIGINQTLLTTLLAIKNPVKNQVKCQV